MESTSQNEQTNVHQQTFRLIVVAATCALILCGVWYSGGAPNADSLSSLDQMRLVTTRAEQCVASLTKTLNQGDGRWESLFTDFPLSSDLVVSVERSDGSARNMNKQQVIAEMSMRGSDTRGRVDELARLLTLKHKRIPMRHENRQLIVLQDNTVVSVNTESCQVDAVYFNRWEGVHAAVRDDVAENIVVARDSGGSSQPASTDEKLKQNCNDQGGSKVAGRRLVAGLKSKGQSVVPAADGRMWCSFMVTYAHACTLYGASCFVWDSERCDRFGASDANPPSCPTGHCCNVKNCPLVADHACKNSPFADSTFDATTVIDNTLVVIDVAVTVLEGVLSVLDKAPVVGAVFGVFNSILGLFGNLAMTPEAALDEAKQYTDELVEDVYKCMDHRFARSWTHHIRVQIEDVKDAVADVQLLSTPLQRIHQCWEPAAQACGAIGNKYRFYEQEYTSGGQANLLIGQTPGALRICSAVFMEYMVDSARDSTRGYDPAKVRSDMKRMVFDLDMFMKTGILHLDAYYRNKSVCGDLNVVTDKIAHISQNLFLPSMVMSSPILGGRVYQSVVLHYTEARISNPPSGAISLSGSKSDPVSCRRACLDNPKCVTAHYQSGSTSCVGYTTTVAHQTSGSDDVYVVKERNVNVMVTGDSNTRVSDASNCLSTCQGSSTCYGSRYESGCQTNPSGNVDYAIFRGAVVVEFANHEWTGTKPTPSTRSIGKCLYECARQPSECVAIEHDGVSNKCYLFLTSHKAYPGKYTLDERDPSLRLRHFDVHYRSSVRLQQPLLTDMNAFPCPGFNIARGKPTGQKSTSSSGASSRGVDGNRDGVYTQNSCTHTSDTTNPWWYVDLQARYDICSVTLTTRSDCCASRLNNFLIFVTDRVPSGSFSVQDSETCVSGEPEFRGTKRFSCAKDKKFVGRYVGVQIIASPAILTLCEVEIRGTRA